MSGEWQGVVSTTARTYLKGAADNTIRNRLLLMMLQKYGRIKTNQTGYDFTWDVQYGQHQLQQYGDMGSINHARQDLYKQLTGDVRGYVMTDLMSEKERSMCGGEQAIINRYTKTMPTMIKTATNRLPGEFYVDGHAAGNENRLCGFGSFMGTGTTVAADWIAKPDDTYFNLDTDLGAYGGTWTANQGTPPNANVAKDWPYGSGDSEFDFNSPKIVNYTSTHWNGSAGTFKTVGYLAMRRGLSVCTHTGGADSRPGIIMLARDLFDDFKASQDSKLNVWVPHKEAQDLGFEDTLKYEGAMVASDFDVASTEGYGININEMELLVSTYDGPSAGELFFCYGPERPPGTLEYKFTLGFFGNLRFNVKHHFKLDNVA